MMVTAALIAIAGALCLQMFFKNRNVPGNLGVRDGLLAPMPASPNAVSSQTESKDKYVAPFSFKGDLKDTKAAIIEILKQHGHVEIVAESPRYIHA